MVRQVLTIAVVVLAATTQAAILRGASDERMRPELVAQTLAHVEDEWRKQAAAFTEGDASAAKEAPAEFAKSCSTVVSAIVQGSGGDRDVAKEYMNKVCSQNVLQDWHKLRCDALASKITDHAMLADSYANRQNLNSQKVCGSYWSVFVEAEKNREAEEAKLRAEQEKVAAEQEKVRAEAEKKAAAEAAEAKKVADAAAKVEAEKKAAEDARVEKKEKEETAKREAEEAKARAAEAAQRLAEKKEEAEKLAKEAQAKLEEAEKAEQEHKERLAEHEKAEELLNEAKKAAPAGKPVVVAAAAAPKPEAAAAAPKAEAKPEVKVAAAAAPKPEAKAVVAAAAAAPKAEAKPALAAKAAAAPEKVKTEAKMATQAVAKK